MNWLISFSRPFLFPQSLLVLWSVTILGGQHQLYIGTWFPVSCERLRKADRVPHIWDGGSNPTECIYIYEIPGFSYKQTTLLISYILYIPPIPISYWHVWHQWTPISNSPMVPPPFQEKILDGQRVAATLHCTTKEEMVSAPRFWPIWEWMETYDSMIYPLVI